MLDHMYLETQVAMETLLLLLLLLQIRIKALFDEIP
jgi:hypothetical protein